MGLRAASFCVYPNFEYSKRQDANSRKHKKGKILNVQKDHIELFNISTYINIILPQKYTSDFYKQVRLSSGLASRARTPQ